MERETPGQRLRPNYGHPHPGFGWDDGKPRDFYVWFGSNGTGGSTLVSGEHTSAPFGYLELRVNKPHDYWFHIRVGDDFVWWANADRRPTPDGVTFD